jgi:hypothetical protein
MSLVSAVCLAFALAGPGPRLGLAMGFPDGATEDDFLAAIRTQIRMGLDGAAPNIKWDEFEAQNGKSLTDAVGAAKLIDQELLVTISTIDTVKKRLPVDVAVRDWTSPEMLARWSGFLTKVAQQAAPRTKWISLGNEVNVYLMQHPTEVDGYIKFLAAGRAALKKVNPHLLVGVTVTCTDALKDPELARRLQEGMDISVFTYYPMDGLKALDPNTVPSHFDFMTRSAGSRPLLLQEIGYPASLAVGSSGAKQAEFVRQVFGQIDRYDNRIALASYFMQTDFSSGLMKVFEGYYGISDPTFLSFLGSLGLCDNMGKPRPAWAVFKAEVAKRRSG